MKRRAIPTLQTGDGTVDDHASAVKHNLDMVTGQHRNSPVLVALASTATTADIIAAINALIQRVQGDA